MDRALYGPGGFYVAGDGAAGHFRTSVSASPSVREVFAGALGELLGRVDAALGRPDPLDLVDVGAGTGALLESILASIGSGIDARIRATAVEVRPAPTGLSPRIGWNDGVPELTGLLIANEWLDNVAVDIVADDRVLLVDPTGAESAGPALRPEDAEWLDRWWPTGVRRELGLHRDSAWVQAVSQVARGLAVAIDYAHSASGRPSYGTLIGFRRGRETDPVPDGSCDMTAHVAIDSVALAGELSAARTADRSAARAADTSRAGAAGVQGVHTFLADQRMALRCLGVSGRRPEYAADPAGYAAALQRASDSAELLDPAGLGAFTWLLQGVGVDPYELLG